MALDESPRLVLEAIIAMTEADGIYRPPTYRGVARYLGKSVGFVQDYVKVLESEGYIRLESGSRGFHVLRNPDGSLKKKPPERSPDSPEPAARPALRLVLPNLAGEGEGLRLPVLGTAAAGEPIEAVDDEPEYAIVDARLCGGRPCYVLRIRGDSMAEDGIVDGSLVVVRAEEGVIPGAIHVCWLPGIGATVKRVRSGVEAAELIASNEDYKPIQAPEGTIIQGRVVQVLVSLK